MSNKDELDGFGCAKATIQILIGFPYSLIQWWLVLSHIEAPQACWYLYFAWIPFAIVLFILGTVEQLVKVK